MHCGNLRNICGSLYPLDAHSTVPTVVTTKNNVSTHRQMSPWVETPLSVENHHVIESSQIIVIASLEGMKFPEGKKTDM